MPKNKSFFWLLCALLLAVTAKAQTTGCGRLYVDSAVTTSGNGSSWATAFKTLTQALDTANKDTCSSREIWVRKGTYYPMSGTTAIAGSRDSSFRILRNGIKLYGGFAGTETVLSARNVATNLTVLSGDIGVAGDSTDNCYHVVTVVVNALNIDTNTRIDGFTVTRGNASAAGMGTSFTIAGRYTNRTDGGGIYNFNASPSIVNCTLFQNNGDEGGGMYNSYCSPAIKNCTFTRNTSYHDGGGMYGYYTSSSIENCIFSSNSAGGHGGGMYTTGGYSGAPSVLASPTITNSTFSFNTAISGGGLYSVAPSISVTNCTFSYNAAQYSVANAGSGYAGGGGLYNYGGTASITKCTFSFNTATANGGGMYNHSSGASIVDCTFSSNATQASTGYGGGIFSNNYSNATLLSIKNCTFTSNSSTNGGGISNAYTAPSIINCMFASNTAVNGGGMHNFGASPAVTNCTFYANSCSYQAGGIYNDNYGTTVITNCILWGNTAPAGGNVDIYSYIRINPVISYTTTQISQTGTANTTANPLFLNTANLIGPDSIWRTPDDGLQLQAGSPAINAGSNPAIPAGITTDIMDSIRIRQGIVDQGAYESIPFVCPAGAVVYVDSSRTLSGNGASWASAYKTLSEGLHAANNCATVTQVWVAKGTYYPMASRTAIAGSRDSSFRILRNGIKLYGGFAGTETALSARNVAANPTVLSGDIGLVGDSADNCYHVVTVVSNNTIDTNTRLDGLTIKRGNANAGGASFLVAGQNISGSSGGGIFNAASSPIIANCTLSFNRSTLGGGMYNAASSPFIANCTFSLNSSDSSGGGMYNNLLSSPLLTNCIFTLNKSDSSGGGMYNSSLSSAPIKNCTFTSNKSKYGGGMCNAAASPAVINCTFTSNSSSNGGGMWNSSASPAVTNCTFASNSSSNSGGGMYNSYSSPFITNCAFSSNISDNNGGGIGNFVASPSITNCTFFANNSNANGGGIANDNSSPQIANCVMWGNSSGIGPDIYNSSNISNPVISYSTTSTVQPGTGNSTANPLFVNAANPIGPDGIWRTNDDGLRLTPCSGAINTGNNAAVPAGTTTDITGIARIQYATVDKGAYEMPYNATGISVTTVSMLPANPVCATTAVTFTATSTAPGSLPAYQWYKNGLAVGSNQATYTSAGWSNGDSVWVVHTNNDCSLNDTSAKIFIQLVPVPASTGTITGNSSPCSGTQIYSVAAVANATTYTWTVPAGWTITAGQGTTSITATSTIASGNVTVLAGNVCSNATVASTLTVASLTLPVLPIGPASVCASSTGNVYSIRAVSGATSYTWTVPAGWVITAGQGTTSITVTASAGNTSGNISVLASNGCPTGAGAPLAVTGGSIIPVLVVGSNSGDTVCAGTNVIFTAAQINGGTTSTYQWKKNGLNVGTNSTIYSTSALVTGDVVSVTLTFTSACVSVPTITASGPPIAVLTNIVPAVVINGGATTALCTGATHTFTTNSTAGGSNPTYRWYKNGMVIPGATASSYTSSTFATNDVFSVVLFSNADCRTLDTVRSNGVVVTVNPNVVPVLTVTANPGTAVPAGTLITFTANVTGAGQAATYQWLKNGNAIAGATNSTYTTNTLQKGDLISVRAAALGPCATPNTLTSEPLRISGPAGIPVVSVGKDGWKESLLLHPNPSSGRFTLTADWGIVSAGERVGVNIVNGLGQLVFSTEVTLKEAKWNLDIQLTEGVANGIYMLRLQRRSDGSSATKPVLIQR